MGCTSAKSAGAAHGRRRGGGHRCLQPMRPLHGLRLRRLAIVHRTLPEAHLGLASPRRRSGWSECSADAEAAWVLVCALPRASRRAEMRDLSNRDPRPVPCLGSPPQSAAGLSIAVGAGFRASRAHCRQRLTSAARKGRPCRWVPLRRVPAASAAPDAAATTRHSSRACKPPAALHDSVPQYIVYREIRSMGLRHTTLLASFAATAAAAPQRDHWLGGAPSCPPS